MKKKSLILITLPIVTILLSCYIFYSNFYSQSLSKNKNYYEKNTDSVNANKPINEDNSFLENKSLSEDEPEISANNKSNVNSINSKINNDNLVVENKSSSQEKAKKISENVSNVNATKSNSSSNNVTNVDNQIQKQNINIHNYLDNLPCISYELKNGETLTDIARRYESSCNLNTTVKMIKSINKINDENNIDAKTVLSIPEYTIKNGSMYKVISGDTWYKVANQYYSKYTADSVMKFLVYVNNLPNNDLPLGESIFLPNI